MPSTTLPKTVYWPFRKEAGAKQMKNWLFPLFGFWLRAMPRVPRSKGRSENSAGGSDKPDLPAEFSDRPFERGTLGMARSQNPNSGNSQFFICFAPASFLNGDYTVFGKVVDGMQYVDLIKKAPESDRSGMVQNPDKMISLKVAADVQ